MITEQKFEASQSALFESLLVKLVAAIQLTKVASGSPQSRQALLLATNEFKTALARAKDYATNLPGGELLVEEQDDIIQMLETIKAAKRNQLVQFSSTKVVSNSDDTSTKMEVDSTASTPEKASS